LSLAALSVSHKTASLAELEQVAIRPAALGDALSRLLIAPDLLEAAVLSTCNRTEVYAWARSSEQALHQMRATLEEFQGLPRGWTAERSAACFGDAVIRHLFLVAAGLESMVPGESEVQGQVREAYRMAAEIGSVGSNLHALFRSALEAGKKARSGTVLAGARRGLSEAAVETVTASLGDLSGRSVLVVGTGKMAGLVIPTLRERGAEVRIATRRMEAASALAGRLGVQAVPIHDLATELEYIDAVVLATIAPHFLLTKGQIGKAASARNGRPQLIIDLGLPRNVEPAAGEIEGVNLYDLERLGAEGSTRSREWDAEIEKARAIALEEAGHCADDFRERAADEFVSRMHDMTDEIARAELERALRKVHGLDEEGRAAVEAAMSRAMRKVVHRPTVRAKEAATRGDQEMLEAARWLFGLADGERFEDS